MPSCAFLVFSLLIFPPCCHLGNVAVVDEPIIRRQPNITKNRNVIENAIKEIVKQFQKGRQNGANVENENITESANKTVAGVLTKQNDKTTGQNKTVDVIQTTTIKATRPNQWETVAPNILTNNSQITPCQCPSSEICQNVKPQKASTLVHNCRFRKYSSKPRHVTRMF